MEAQVAQLIAQAVAQQQEMMTMQTNLQEAVRLYKELQESSKKNVEGNGERRDHRRESDVLDEKYFKRMEKYRGDESQWSAWKFNLGMAVG